MKSTVTSVDVARLAGVSQSTVSRAISSGAVSEATRQEVFAAARKLNYVPNSIARSLTKRSSNIVAIVIGDLSNSFYSAAFSALSARLQDVGKQVLVFNVNKSRDVDSALRRALEYQVDGLIVLEAASAAIAREFLERGVAVVVFNRHIPELAAHTVCCDNAGGARLAANALLEAGARRFAIIYGNRDSRTNRDRITGFLEALRSSGAPMHDVPDRCGEYTYDGGFRAACELLRSAERTDAIFCTDDMMAFGAMDAARSCFGLRIPEDLLIMGFDGVEAAARTVYRLSTIRQPLTEMVEAAVDLVSRQVDGAPLVRVLPTSLILRESTARRRQPCASP